MFSPYPTLQELQIEAWNSPEELNWEMIDKNDHTIQDFEDLMARGIETTDALEDIYTQLTSGDTELPQVEVEQYISTLQSELVASYKIQDLLHRYFAVKEMTA